MLISIYFHIVAAMIVTYARSKATLVLAVGGISQLGCKFIQFVKALPSRQCKGYVCCSGSLYLITTLPEKAEDYCSNTELRQTIYINPNQLSYVRVKFVVRGTCLDINQALNYWHRMAEFQLTRVIFGASCMKYPLIIGTDSGDNWISQFDLSSDKDMLAVVGYTNDSSLVVGQTPNQGFLIMYENLASLDGAANIKWAKAYDDQGQRWSFISVAFSEDSSQVVAHSIDYLGGGAYHEGDAIFVFSSIDGSIISVLGYTDSQAAYSPATRGFAITNILTLNLQRLKLMGIVGIFWGCLGIGTPPELAGRAIQGMGSKRASFKHHLDLYGIHLNLKSIEKPFLIIIYQVLTYYFEVIITQIVQITQLQTLFTEGQAIITPRSFLAQFFVNLVTRNRVKSTHYISALNS